MRCSPTLLFVVGRLMLGVLIPLAVPLGAIAAEKYRIDEPVDDVRVFGVGMRVEVNGKLSTPIEAGKVATHVLDATATLSFRERRLLGPGVEAAGLRSMREYEQAKSDIKVSQEVSSLTMPDRLKLVVVQGSNAGLEFYSLEGSLTGAEHQLLQAPGDPLALVSLLPRQPVDVGESWTPPNWVAQFLASHEALAKSDLKCTLKSVENQQARIEYKGQIEGAVAGTLSTIDVSGTLIYDLASKSISQADVQQTEKRAVGATTPGLEITARTRMLRRPAQVPGKCGDTAIVERATEPMTGDQLLFRFNPPYGLSLLHARQWIIYKETKEVAILRLLEGGTLVAQCNLSPIPTPATGRTTPEQFERDVQTALGDRFGSFESKETLDGTLAPLYLYRVVAKGKATTGEMTWIYYLAADAKGRQASLMFAVESANLERFGEQDRALVSTLRFAPR